MGFVMAKPAVELVSGGPVDANPGVGAVLRGFE